MPDARVIPLGEGDRSGERAVDVRPLVVEQCLVEVQVRLDQPGDHVLPGRVVTWAVCRGLLDNRAARDMHVALFEALAVPDVCPGDRYGSCCHSS